MGIIFNTKIEILISSDLGVLEGELKSVRGTSRFYIPDTGDYGANLKELNAYSRRRAAKYGELPVKYTGLVINEVV